MSKYKVSAYKMVKLQPELIDADSEAEAREIYLQKAKAGEVEIQAYDWFGLSDGDLDSEESS